tara:strand:- start:7851 stop:8825 length:975 start_codon:yes stop_codon:yes gene_type:complete
MTKLLIVVFSSLSIFGFSQSYAPAAGEPGSTAIDKNDARFKGWATGIDVERGFVNIEDTLFEAQGSNRATFGDPELALGPAVGTAEDVVSLGDKGIATLTFDQPVFNGPGFDFAVFENSFSDTYLEFAHVEVSSDGQNFVRFPSHSEVQTNVQIHGFGTTDPRMINNLAGKYRAGFGTPFDLDQLKDSSNLDVTQITHIRIIDVVGSVGDSATYDSHGNKINEPFSTPYESGGFDLEAVGVLNQVASLSGEESKLINIYPNPAKSYTSVDLNGQQFDLMIFDSYGKCVHKSSKNFKKVVKLNPGVYHFQIITSSEMFINKIVFN